MEQEAEPAVFLLGIVFRIIFFCEEENGAYAVAVFGRVVRSFGQSVCRELDEMGAAIFDGQEYAAHGRTRPHADAAQLLFFVLLCLNGVLEEIAEDKREIDFGCKRIRQVDLDVDRNVFLARLLDVDGKRGVHYGIRGKVFDAGGVDLIAETRYELHGGLVLTARDKAGEHLDVVPEVVTDDSKTRLFVLHGACIGAEGVHAAQESKAALGRRRLREDVLESTPCRKCDKYARGKKYKTREEVMRVKNFITEGVK